MTVHRLSVDPVARETSAVERLRALLHAATDAFADVLLERDTTARQTSEPERLLTAADVAQRTGLSLDYVYRHGKRWPFARKIGRAMRFSEAGLERWLANRRPSP